MKQVFNTAWARTDSTKRARHGLPWTEEELADLRYRFMRGETLEHMSVNMHRPGAGVIEKLRYLELVLFDTKSCAYYYRVTPTQFIQPIQPIQPTQEEPTMITPKFPAVESKTFIFGDDAANMTDAEIFAKIGSIEGKIANLEKIQTKPKKLMAVIDDMKADIASLVAYVDGRP